MQPQGRCFWREGGCLGRAAASEGVDTTPLPCPFLLWVQMLAQHTAAFGPVPPTRALTT